MYSIAFQESPVLLFMLPLILQISDTWKYVEKSDKILKLQFL